MPYFTVSLSSCSKEMMPFHCLQQYYFFVPAVLCNTGHCAIPTFQEFTSALLLMIVLLSACVSFHSVTKLSDMKCWSWLLDWGRPQTEWHRFAAIELQLCYSAAKLWNICAWRRPRKKENKEYKCPKSFSWNSFALRIMKFTSVQKAGKKCTEKPEKTSSVIKSWQWKRTLFWRHAEFVLELWQHSHITIFLYLRDCSQMGKFSLYAVIMQQHSLFEPGNGGESASLDVCSVNILCRCELYGEWNIHLQCRNILAYRVNIYCVVIIFLY